MASGVSRVLHKLENSVKNGNYYEAHQLYRTIYFRYLGQKRYDELTELLYDGANLFLNQEQHESGADLAILLTDVLTKSECREVSKWAPKLSKLFSRMKPDTPEREKFLAKTLRWSAQGNKYGYPQLHQNIAQIYWNEKNYAQARHHFLYSADGHSCARLLIEFQTLQGYSGEVDLFIAQAVLQFLCLSNKHTASQTFHSYTKQHPNIQKDGPPYLLPLLNFLWFLLQAVESRKLATFTVLCEKYQPSINRDPCYSEYLEKIGQIFFGVQPRRRQTGGLFGNLLQNFLSGLDDDSDEDGVQASSSQQAYVDLD